MVKPLAYNIRVYITVLVSYFPIVLFDEFQLFIFILLQVLFEFIAYHFSFIILIKKIEY